MSKKESVKITSSKTLTEKPVKNRKKKEYTQALPYKIYNGNLNTKLTKPKEDYIIAAIDPAFKNCAVRIEGKNSLTVFQQKYSFSKNKETEVCYNNIIEVFTGLKEKLSTADFILIESQHHKNKDMLKIGQTILTVLLMLFSSKQNNNPPLIIEVEAKIKSNCKYMGEEDGVKGKIKKPELKKWAVTKGLEILKRNSDHTTVEIISKEKKKDDHCDVILYTYCWRRYFCC